MRRPTSVRKGLAVAASSLATFSAGVTVAVLVATSASAASPTKSPAERFLVINGTVNAASIHVVAGSSAFPNFATGAFDNYYSLAHSHVDNSPSAQGRASPFDTGPVGQTAAAGHFQQPQYADARWPGDSGKATYGKQGEPYAVAEASEYKATAEASAASNGSSGSSAMPVPEGLDDRLRRALAEWKATWLDRLDPKKPTDAVTVPKAPAITAPKSPAITTPKAPTVTTPTAPPVTTPAATVTTPAPTPPPPVPPPPPLPPPVPTTPPRTLASASPSADGGSLLASSTLATLDPKTNALVTSGESSLGRVSLGGGQIVIKGIHVSASIANDGSPTYKVAVSVADASIGGVPVTIDQDGVHVAGRSQALPYEEASDALNGALKQAGIQLFLVAPEVTTCPQTGTGTTTTASTTPSDQPGTPGSCEQAGMTPTPPTCDQTGTETTSTSTSTSTSTTTTSTSTTPLPTPTPTPPRDEDEDEPDTTTTTSSCGGMGTTKSPPSACVPTGTATGTTTTSTTASTSTGATTTTGALPLPGTTTTTTTSSSDQTAAGPGTTSPGQATGQQTVRATGVHVVFTQPVNQSGVPAQNAALILGEVFLDSLAVPAGPLPELGLSPTSASSSSSSSCPGGGGSTRTGASGGASLAGGSSSGSLSPSASTFGSAAQPFSSSASGSGSSAGAGSLPAALASALRKPLWLLLAYVLWQGLVIGTGVSLWNWRRGEAS